MHFASRSRASKRALLAAAIALAPLTLSTQAGAYCRTSVCNGGDAGQLCVPSQPVDCGIPLFWRTRCVGWSAQREASTQVSLDVVEALMTQAFAAWENADCGAGQGPSIAGQNLGSIECSVLEYNQEIGNANAVVFRDDKWPYTGMGNTLALTTVTYSLDNGEIFDTDLEVNGTSDVTLTTSDTDVVYDLLSILTHETGHMLGLAHSNDPTATMKVEYVPGDLSLRDLAPDDVNAICAAFPPDRQAVCDAQPRHGFSSQCVDPSSDEGGCQCAHPGARPGAPPSAPNSLAVAAAIGALILRRRRRR
jgi:MYXO-CTERM domain-containing protein